MKHYDTVLRDMLGTLDRHLASNEYVAGAYSIADMTMYPDVHLTASRTSACDIPI